MAAVPALHFLPVGRAGRQAWEHLAFAQMALLRLCVSPVTFTLAFPGGYNGRFRESVCCHFALKVIHLPWMSSFFETRVGVPSGGGPHGGQGMGVRTWQVWI